jgi:hypothetical protein
LICLDFDGVIVEQQYYPNFKHIDYQNLYRKDGDMFIMTDIQYYATSMLHKLKNADLKE